MTEPASESTKQVDLFGDNLIGDFMDAPISVTQETSGIKSKSSEVDLFADADFVSAEPEVDRESSAQTKVRFFFHSFKRWPI